MNALYISRQQARELDRRAVSEYGLNSLVLMENAGRGAADLLCTLGIAGPVCICCGAGNNGGDGFVMARHLDLRGHEVRVLLVGERARLRGDAAANFTIIERSGLAITNVEDGAIDGGLSGAAWIVDALLGTGAVGEPRGPIATAIDRINRSSLPVMAVDLPSGLDCDSGQAANHTVRATHTCTFVAAKKGFLAPEAQPYLGICHVADIGAPRRLVDELLAQGTGR